LIEEELLSEMTRNDEESPDDNIGFQFFTSHRGDYGSQGDLTKKTLHKDEDPDAKNQTTPTSTAPTPSFWR
jgi:hypothetical protein